MCAKPIRVLIVDDHAVARNGMRLMLSAVDDIEVAAEAETAQAALQLAALQQFEVALVDIALPDSNGLDLIKRLREQHPRLAVLVLSMYAEDVYAIRAFKHGAAGYLTKNCTTDNLVCAIRKAAGGGKYLSASIMERFAFMLEGERALPHDALTDRELDVLKQLAGGHSLVMIGRQLHLSPTTVSSYRTRILEKMDMKTNAELIRYVIEKGLLA